MQLLLELIVVVMMELLLMIALLISVDEHNVLFFLYWGVDASYDLVWRLGFDDDEHQHY